MSQLGSSSCMIFFKLLYTTSMAPHSSTLAWEIPWRRSLVGYSPWGLKESDTTEQLHFHFSLSCIGEGNGNPLQCSCLETPRDGEPGGLPSMGLHMTEATQHVKYFLFLQFLKFLRPYTIFKVCLNGFLILWNIAWKNNKLQIKYFTIKTLFIQIKRHPHLSEENTGEAFYFGI